jgi:hypothetical protein
MSDEEKLKEGEFRVVDKRRFTSEGDTRDKTEEPRRRDSVPPETAKSAMAQKSPQAASSPKSSVGERSDDVDFSSLIVSLATQALMMMGEVPGSETSGANLNLDAAKQTIDVLALLEAKTKGNLTPDEQKLMAEILTSLRLAYVKKSGR